MYRSFGDTAIEPVEERRDKEITLGPVMLAVLGFALVALCGLCFMGGYAVGHGGQEQTASAPAASSSPSATQLLREGPKPAASDNRSQTQPAPQSSQIAPPAEQQPSAPAASSAPANYSPAPGAAPAVVHAALPAQGLSATPASSDAAVQSALPQASSWMVQIAAVSHSEDADVLMSALKQRGYAVSMHRDLSDNLIHVQVGPISTHNDAVAMRQRLLNDGYNAVIQP